MKKNTQIKEFLSLAGRIEVAQGQPISIDPQLASDLRLLIKFGIEFEELAFSDAGGLIRSAITEPESLRQANLHLLEACERLIGSLHVMLPDGDNCEDIIFARAVIQRNDERPRLTPSFSSVTEKDPL